MGPGTRLHRPEDPDRQRPICIFSRSPAAWRRLQEWESPLSFGWTETLSCISQAAPTFDDLRSRARLIRPCTIQQPLPPHRDHGVLFFVAFSAHGRKMSTSTSASIAVNCSYLWVSVLSGSQDTAIVKLLRSRCFATIELSPYFAKQPNVSRNANSVTTPSRAAVRAATSDFPLVTFPSLMRTEQMRARASTDGASPFFPPECILPLPASRTEFTCKPSPHVREIACDHRGSALRIHNSCTPRSSREYGPPRVLSQ